jgi:DNA-directed RNA polymerase subunit RPC12/RpoP
MENMMKVTYTTKNNRLKVEIEGESQKDVFESLAKFQEVFDENACGKCASENLKFIVRNVEDNQYYELRCADCGAKLAFGVHKKGGGLFPKRKDGDNWLPNNGWQKWNSKTNAME